MPVPNIFANATSTIPLSQLDANFATTITLGNTAIQLGNSVSTLNNMTLANVTISNVSAAITVVQGGTGTTTLTTNNVILGNGANTVKVVAPGTNGNVLTSDGTTWVSTAPGAATGNITIGNTTVSLGGTATSIGNLTLTNVSITSGSITGITDLAIADGGTGASSKLLAFDNLSPLTTKGDLIGYDGTDNVRLAVGSNGQVLTANSSAATGLSWAAGGGSAFPSGTLMLFQQTSAPTGWTKQTTHDNKALRVVSGSASSGGSVNFTTAFASQAVSGTVGSTTLTTPQIPSHTHSSVVGTYAAAGTGCPGDAAVTGGSTGATGGGGSHNHTFTGTAINLAVSYVDLIIASAN